MTKQDKTIQNAGSQIPTKDNPNAGTEDFIKEMKAGMSKIMVGTLFLFHCFTFINY